LRLTVVVATPGRSLASRCKRPWIAAHAQRADVRLGWNVGTQLGAQAADQPRQPTAARIRARSVAAQLANTAQLTTTCGKAPVAEDRLGTWGAAVAGDGQSGASLRACWSARAWCPAQLMDASTH